jgi:hypothetical protein
MQISSAWRQALPCRGAVTAGRNAAALATCTLPKANRTPAQAQDNICHNLCICREGTAAAGRTGLNNVVDMITAGILSQPFDDDQNAEQDKYPGLATDQGG